MRKKRDGESTREAVIQAATQAFAEKGFSGTSLALISDKCGISDGLILHHFQNKENLYHTVLEELAAQYQAALQQAGANAENTQQAAMASLRAAFQYWREDSAYYRISMWAFLEGRDDLIAQEIKLTAGLAQTIQTMQANGQADARFAPYAFLPMTVGPLHFWMSHRALFKKALGLAGDLETLDAQFEEQYLEMMMMLYQLQA